MAYSNGITKDNTKLGKHDWEKHYIYDIGKVDYIKLLADDIGSNSYRIYRVGKGLFFLTDKHNEYVGYLEINLDNHIGKITSAYSTITGFYKIMFTTIFAHTEITEILSDQSLSPGAIKSYYKLSKDNLLEIKIRKGMELVDFSEEELLSHPLYRVSITEKFENSLQSVFENYYSKLSSSSMLRDLQEQKDPILDQMLFGDL